MNFSILVAKIKNFKPFVVKIKEFLLEIA